MKKKKVNNKKKMNCKIMMLCRGREKDF